MQSFSYAMAALDSDDPIPGSAETEVNKALGADPIYTPALMAKAAIESQKGDNAGAAVIYNGILQKWPDFAPAQKYLAAIYANEPANAGKLTIWRIRPGAPLSTIRTCGERWAP